MLKNFGGVCDFQVGKIVAIMASPPKAFSSDRYSLQLPEECFTRSIDTRMAKWVACAEEDMEFRAHWLPCVNLGFREI